MPGLLLRERSRRSSSPSPPPTMNQSSHRRSFTFSRRSSSQTPPPQAQQLQGLGLQLGGDLGTVMGKLVEAEIKCESDRECWSRMLALQREFHCYNSARLEAAVEALEMGWRIEEVPIPSRLCLDLLNEELRQQIDARNAFESIGSW